MNPFEKLVKSRKFWLAVYALVQTLVAHYLNVPADVILKLDAIVLVLIGSIAVEDAASNIHNPPVKK